MVNMDDFAQDLYDLLGMNGISQEEFFIKYVAEDKAFMIDSYRNKDIIIMDNYTITIKPNR